MMGATYLAYKSILTNNLYEALWSAGFKIGSAMISTWGLQENTTGIPTSKGAIGLNGTVSFCLTRVYQLTHICKLHLWNYDCKLFFWNVLY